MKKLTTSVALIALSVSLSTHSENYTAKHIGQGFTSLTHDFTSSISNPALLTKFDNDDDIYISLSLGLNASDEYSVLDIGEDISDEIDVLDESIKQVSNEYDHLSFYQKQNRLNNLQDQVDEIVDNLKLIDEKPVQIGGGINALVIIPNQYLSFGLFVNQYARLGINIDFSDSDENILTHAISPNTLELDTDDITSEAIGLGFSVAEAGVMLGYQVINSELYDVNIGTKIKYQRVDLLYTSLGMVDFDEDDFDIDDSYTDASGVNVDLGIHIALGEERQWNFALIVDDIISQEINLIQQNTILELELAMTSSVGISYQQEWFTLSAELDLTDRNGFEQLTAPKYASVGAQLNLGEHAQLRLGARTDLNDVEGDVVTAGLGLSPWDVFSFDIAVFAGQNDNAGAAMQLGVKF